MFTYGGLGLVQVGSCVCDGDNLHKHQPDKASFGVVVHHDGVFQELEGTRNGRCGTLPILHCDHEGVGRHLICSVFSRPAGDFFSKLLPAKTRT